MEVKVYYSKIQLEDTIKFIITNNSTFKNKYDIVKESINSCINDIVNFYPKYTSISTMGFTVIISDEEHEDLDNDDNIINIDILVDPSLGNMLKHNIDPEDDNVEIIKNIKGENKNA